MAQEKTSKIAKRIKTDPLFERTRQTIEEFKRSGKAAKLLLDALRQAGVYAKDRSLFSRLNTQMFKVIKTDGVHRRGERLIVNGDMSLIRGFDFNINGKLSSLLFIQPTATIDRASGTMKVELPPFVPKELIKAPLNATYFTIACAAAEIDFATGTFVTATASTEALPYNDEKTAAISLTATVPANSTKWLLLAVGLAFNDETNDKADKFLAGKFNALLVAAVDSPAV